MAKVVQTKHCVIVKLHVTTLSHHAGPVLVMLATSLIGSLLFQALNSLLEKKGAFYRNVSSMRKFVHNVSGLLV
jgi:hypothetical protein